MALHLYGQLSATPRLDWDWVDSQLKAAGTYWVVARTQGHPHPRPVWGIWENDHFCLSIGTPVTLRAVALDPVVTVHLDSGTDVVIVEGRAAGAASGTEAIDAYNQKYDWSYDAGQYGPLQRVDAGVVLAWRTAGWAGRDSFQQTGRWDFRS
jgi:hypothetical protein